MCCTFATLSKDPGACVMIYGLQVSRKRVQRLMRQMGIRALYPGAKTTGRNLCQKVYPYLFRNLKIRKVNQVGCTDITYIPMRKGFLYLVAIMDWHSKKSPLLEIVQQLGYRPCIEALEEALAQHGRPDIFKSDQGCQFTSADFTGILKDKGIQISMDGKGPWIDNVFIERLWRRLKYEEVCLKAYDIVAEAKENIGIW